MNRQIISLLLATLFLCSASYAQENTSARVPVTKEEIKLYMQKLRETGMLEEDLTDEEIDIIYRRPERAQRIAEISLLATIKARELYRLDSSVPEDVYRHVLWSYWLTLEFGEEFAKEVTDAHEAGEVADSAAEIMKDKANNKIGRIYAGKKYSEEEVIRRIKTDPKVKRSPTW